MSVSRYKLTRTGWIGAMLFVLPTPIAAFHVFEAGRLSAGQVEFNKALLAVGGMPDTPISAPFLVALSTLTLVGLVLLLVGREIVSEP